MSKPTVTLVLAEQACALTYDVIPENARRIISQCVLDYLGVTLAGIHEPAVQLLAQELEEEGGAPQASIIGTARQMSLSQAALLNGMASHAIDYDDVNFALMGHPSVPILPALLAQAEALHSSGEALMTAFLAGYEAECRVGLLVAPGHYAAGFHATATVGTIGAAVACAKLLGVDTPTMTQAIGIAATQAAGLKSMFGSACKPFHAGMAARSGLLAARLALRGFDSRSDSLECDQGFAATHSPNFAPEAALATPPGGLHLFANLFKYHASCYETHATIECGRALRQQYGLRAEDIESVEVLVNPYCDRICNIPRPASGLEAKFSLRQTAAMALSGIETADPAAFNDALAHNVALLELGARIHIGFDAAVGQGCARMQVARRSNGKGCATEYNAATPWSDLDAQQTRLEEKFMQLASPVLGAAQARELADGVAALSALEHIEPLIVLATI